MKQKIMEKYAINAYAVRNEVSQRITEKAIQNPNASKGEAAMMENLVYEQLNYVRIKDVLGLVEDARTQISQRTISSMPHRIYYKDKDECESDSDFLLRLLAWCYENELDKDHSIVWLHDVLAVLDEGVEKK